MSHTPEATCIHRALLHSTDLLLDYQWLVDKSAVHLGNSQQCRVQCFQHRLCRELQDLPLFQPTLDLMILWYTFQFVFIFDQTCVVGKKLRVKGASGPGHLEELSLLAVMVAKGQTFHLS